MLPLTTIISCGSNPSTTEKEVSKFIINTEKQLFIPIKSIKGTKPNEKDENKLLIPIKNKITFDRVGISKNLSEEEKISQTNEKIQQIFNSIQNENDVISKKLDIFTNWNNESNKYDKLNISLLQFLINCNNEDEYQNLLKELQIENIEIIKFKKDDANKIIEFSIKVVSNKIYYQNYITKESELFEFIFK